MPRTGTPLRERRPAALIRARLGVTGLFLANGAGFGAWASSIAGVKEALAASDGALGAALLCSAAGAMLAMPVAGWLGAKGVPRFLSLTALFFALVLPLPALVGSVPALAATLILLGAGAGSMDVSMNARATLLQEEWRAAIMSSFHAAFALGGLLGTGAVALSQGVGAGVLGGLLATSCFIAAAGAAHAWLDPDPRLAASGAKVAWPNAAVAGVGLLCFCAFLTEGGVGDWSAVFLRGVAGFSPPAAASGFAAFEVAMVIGRLTGDATVRRFGPARVLRWGAVMAACGIVITALLPWAGPLGFGLVGLGGANIAPILFTAGGRAGPTGVAAVATLGYGGMLLGPPLIGGLAEIAGLRIGLLIAAAAMTAIALGSTRVKS